MDNLAKFTPGPWEAIPDEGFTTEIHHEGQFIAFVSGAEDFPCFDGDRRELLIETTANANLIAAAPDLYRLLEKACEDLGGRDQLDIAFIDEMEGALAKARGQK